MPVATVMAVSIVGLHDAAVRRRRERRGCDARSLGGGEFYGRCREDCGGCDDGNGSSHAVTP